MRIITSQNITGYHLKPWQRPHIKTQVYWVGTVLSEKSVMKKYGYSDKEMLQGRVDSDGYQLPEIIMIKLHYMFLHFYG